MSVCLSVCLFVAHCCSFLYLLPEIVNKDEYKSVVLLAGADVDDISSQQGIDYNGEIYK